MSISKKWKVTNEKTKLRAIFKKYDFNKSKSLQEEELLIALMKSFGLKMQLVSIDACKDLIRDYIKKFDINQDGSIQFDEFYEIYKAMKSDITNIPDEDDNTHELKLSQESKAFKILRPDQRKYKLILCVDGGGVRGVIAITFLHHLEKALGCKLHDIFDLCAGTSTGSVIAGGIAGLGSSANQVRKFYELDTLSRVMPKSLTDKVLGVVQNEALYKSDGKVEVLEEFFGDRKLKDCVPHLVIPVYNITKRKLECLTKRKHGEIYIKDAINASSAAPVYYPPSKIGDDWFIDGGVAANDPTMCAVAEAIKIWGDDVPIKVLSIGTGKLYKHIDGDKAYSKRWGAVQWFSDGDFINILLDSTTAVYQATEILGDNYLRVNDSLEPYHISEEIDDNSTTNYSNMINMGDKMWELNKEKVMGFLLGQQDSENDDFIHTEHKKERKHKHHRHNKHEE